MNGERLSECMVELTKQLTYVLDQHDDCGDISFQDMIISKKYAGRLCDAAEILLKKSTNLGKRFDINHPGIKDKLNQAVMRAKTGDVFCLL